MKGLTSRQQETLDAIRRLTATEGIPPTRRELGKVLGVKSTNGVTDHLRALVRKGYIGLDPMLSRGIHLLDGSAPTCALDEASARRMTSLEGRICRARLLTRTLSELSAPGSEARCMAEMILSALSEGAEQEEKAA